MSNPAKLEPTQVFNEKGCGGGTLKACFAIIAGPKGLECAMKVDETFATQIGSRLDWRMNIDDTDGRPWCPLGVLANSKKE